MEHKLKCTDSVQLIQRVAHEKTQPETESKNMKKQERKGSFQSILVPGSSVTLVDGVKEVDEEAVKKVRVSVFPLLF